MAKDFLIQAIQANDNDILNWIDSQTNVFGDAAEVQRGLNQRAPMREALGFAEAATPGEISDFEHFQRIEAEAQAEDFGPLETVLPREVAAGMAQGLRSTQRAIGTRPASDSMPEQVAMRSQIRDPSLLGDVQRGAGGVIADIPLIAAGLPLAAGATALRAPTFFRIAAGVQPMAMRSAAERARQDGTGAAIQEWAIETSVPALFGRSGIERVFAGAGKKVAVDSFKSLATQVLRQGAGGAISEGSEEAATELAHMIFDYAVQGNERAFDDMERRLAAAGIVGGAFGSAVNIAQIQGTAKEAADAVAKGLEEMEAEQGAEQGADAVEAPQGPTPAAALEGVELAQDFEDRAQVSEADIQRAIGGTVERIDSGYRVTTKTGNSVDVVFAEHIRPTQAEVDAQASVLGIKKAELQKALDDGRFDAVGSAMATPTIEGVEVPVLGVVALDVGRADPKKLRHELYHLADRLGLFTEEERAKFDRFATVDGAPVIPNEYDGQRALAQAEAAVQRATTDAERAQAEVNLDNARAEARARGTELLTDPSKRRPPWLQKIFDFFSGLVGRKAYTQMREILADPALWERAEVGVQPEATEQVQEEAATVVEPEAAQPEPAAEAPPAADKPRIAVTGAADATPEARNKAGQALLDAEQRRARVRALAEESKRANREARKAEGEARKLEKQEASLRERIAKAAERRDAARARKPQVDEVKAEKAAAEKEARAAEKDAEAARKRRDELREKAVAARQRRDAARSEQEKAKGEAVEAVEEKRGAERQERALTRDERIARARERVARGERTAPSDQDIVKILRKRLGRDFAFRITPTRGEPEPKRITSEQARNLKKTMEELRKRRDAINEEETQRIEKPKRDFAMNPDQFYREADGFTEEQVRALDEVLTDREIANMQKHSGTPYVRMAQQGALVRAALQAVLDGKDAVDSFWDSESVRGSRAAVEAHGADGVYFYLNSRGWLGNASNPGHHASSSYLDCSPSEACAAHCYASTGRNHAGVLVRQELMRFALNHDPKRAAEGIARDYKGTAEYHANKALRINERGDLSEGWVKAIGYLNEAGIRVQVFSKRPELLERISDYNLRLLSIDSSNADIAEGNTLPLAVAWAGEADNAILERYRGRVQVVLPIKIGHKVLSPAEIAKMPEWARKHACPVDAGKTKVGKWTCTRCDANGGMGCFFGKATQALRNDLANGVDQNELLKRLYRLKELTQGEGHADSGPILAELDALIGDVRATSDASAKVGRATETAGGDGRTGTGPAEARAGNKRNGRRGRDLAITGRPDLANPGQTPEARRLVDLVDAVMAQETSTADAKNAMDEIDAVAEEMIAEDLAGEIDRMLEENASYTPLDVAIAQKLVRRFSDEASKAGLRDPELMQATFAMVSRYREMGSEQARAFAMRRDQLESPADRSKRLLFESVSTPGRERHRRISRLRKKGDKESLEKARELQAEYLRSLNAKVLAPLRQQYGIDIAQIPDRVLNSPVEMARLFALVSSLKGNVWGVVEEFVYASFLSNPVTHSVNLSSSAIHGIWMATVERGMHQLASVIPGWNKDTEKAYMGEWRYGLTGMLRGIGLGLTSFIKTMTTERAAFASVTESRLNGQLAEQASRTDDPHSPMIGKLTARLHRHPFRQGATLAQRAGGVLNLGGALNLTERAVGRVLRGVSTTFMSATDDAMRAFFTHWQVGQFAYRLARNEGLTGEALSNRVTQLMNDKASEAWRRAYNFSLEALFQNPLDPDSTADKIAIAIQGVRDLSIPETEHAMFNLLSGFRPLFIIVPFIRTPWQLAKKMVVMSPYAGIGVAADVTNMLMGKGVAPGATMRMARLVLAGVALSVIAALDDEDEEPMITGSNGGWRRGKWDVDQLEKPAYSINWTKLTGQKGADGRTIWVEYRRLDPLSKMLALSADLHEAYVNRPPADSVDDILSDHALIGVKSMHDSLIDQTMLAGLRDFLQMAGEIKEQKDPWASAKRWASRQASAVMPNAVRGPARNLENDMPETRVWEAPDGSASFSTRTLEQMQVVTDGPYPKRDPWGGRRTRYGDTPATPMWYNLLAPTKVRVGDDPSSRRSAMNRLIATVNHDNATDQWWPIRRHPWWGSGKGRRFMTSEQYDDFQKRGGRLSLAIATALRLNHEAPTIQDRDAIKRAMSAGYSIIKPTVADPADEAQVAVNHLEAVYQAALGNLRLEESRGAQDDELAGIVDRIAKRRRSAKKKSAAVARAQLKLSRRIWDTWAKKNGLPLSDTLQPEQRPLP